MKIIYPCAAILIIFLFCAGAFGADLRAGAASPIGFEKAVVNVSSDYAPDELIVRFTTPQTNEKIARKVEKLFGGKTTRLHKITTEYSGLGLPNTYLLTLSAGDDPRDVREKYRKDSEVLWAEPNYKVSIELVPGDPAFAQLWGLHNTGQTGGTPDADIDAPEAWDLGTGSAEVVVAVVDTGVDYNHPDLASNIWINTDEISGNGIDDDHNGYIDDVRGWDFYNKDNNPMDDNNHGTHCAGTIGAAGSNGIGVSGVMWNVRIMPLKFMSSGGSGYTSDAVSAILYANRNGAHVISNSWGGSGYSQALKDAIDASPAVVVCAAGNSGVNTDSSPFYPASYTSSNIISVAATDSKDAKASFSNYGANSVDVAAPGVSIYSTLKSGYYGSMSGTSMATPHVAGLAGLLKAKDPSQSNLAMKNRILSTCDAVAPLQGKVLTSGRINAFKALSSLQPAAFSIVSISPTSGINNSMVSVTLMGAGLDTTATHEVKLVGPDEIIGSGVNVISPTRLECTFDLREKTAGIYDVMVTQNTESKMLPGAFTVVALPPPVPVITLLSPSSAVAGGPGFSLTVSGTNFTSSSIVRWNGNPRTTTNITATQVHASLDASDISVPGTAIITVYDPGRGTSNEKTFTITSPATAPSVSSVSPNLIKRGTTKSLSITGNNFVTGASVELRKTTYAPLACTNEAVTGSTKISCVIAPPSTSSGYWDMVVINPDGKTGTKARAIYIY